MSVFPQRHVLAPALTIVQNAMPAALRTTASAILLLVINLVGLGGGSRARQVTVWK